MVTTIKQLPSLNKQPTLEQLQRWAKEWQRIKQLQHLESDSGNPNTISDEETEQIERKNSAVALLRMKHTGQLAIELGRALNEMDVVPPWQEEKKAMNRYQTDQSVLIPLTLRFLDHLRHLKDTGYAALREVGHQYGCVSPISRILAAQRDLTIDKNQKDKYAKKLKEYVNTLTERLLREREAFIERYEQNESDSAKAEAEQDLRNLVEQCVITISNSETRLADIDQEFSLSITGMIDQIMQDGFYIPNYFMSVDGERVIEDRKKIEDLITHSNLEKKAELDMDYYYELAFYDPQYNIDEGVWRPAYDGEGWNRIPIWLINSHAIGWGMSIQSPANPPLQFASVSVMRSLFSNLIDRDDVAELKKEDVLIANAKWACANSSYGGVRCFLEAIKKGNIALKHNDWFEMLLGAINGHDPDVLSSAMKVILPMKELMEVDHNWLITTAVKADMDSEETRYGYSRLDALLDAGIKIYNRQEWQGEGQSYPLGFACAMGCKRPVIEKLIQAGADINAKDDNGKTVLMYACADGHGEIVSQLIEAEADLSIADNNGKTALIYACADGHGEIVSQLIKAEADLSIANNNGKTALMYACADGHGEIVLQLIEAEADLSIADNDGVTALMVACQEGHGDIASQLIQAGADVNATDNTGGTALIDACRQGHEAVVTKLIEAGADVNAKDSWGDTTLMKACAMGHGEIVTQLIEAGADVNATNDTGGTALIYACIVDCVKVVSTLIGAGIDVNAKNKDGKTALIEACQYGHEIIVATLLKAGAEVDAVSTDKEQTALMYACEDGNEAVVTKLIKARAKVNTKNYQGQTPLMIAIACEDGNEAIVTKLIEAKADLNIVNYNGNTALMIASIHGDEAIVTKLIEAKADLNIVNNIGNTALMKACAGGHGDIASQLIQAGADVNITTNRGETILMTAAIRAAIRGDEDIVKQLINANADLDQTSNCFFSSNSGTPYLQLAAGETILMTAAIRGDEDIVKQLINANADLDQTSHCFFSSNSRTDCSNLTILQLAAIAGTQESVGILLDAGASVDARNNRGLTALMCACREGNESIVTQLLEAGSDALASDNDGNHVADYAKKTGKREIINAVEKAIKSSYTLSLSRENRLGNIPTSGINSSHATMEPGRVLEELSTAAQKMNPSQDAPRPR